MTLSLKHTFSKMFIKASLAFLQNDTSVQKKALLMAQKALQIQTRFTHDK